MHKVLFVCHGNICRSPMAEFVLKDMARKRGVLDRLEIASVAASCEELGNGMYGPARRELAKHGVPVEPHRARLITQADYDRFDRIYYMDSRNLRYLRRLFPKENSKLQPFLSRDVADPWYSGDFATAFNDISKGVCALLKSVDDRITDARLRELGF